MKLLKRKKANQTPVRTPRDPGGRSAPVFSYYSKRSAETDVTTRSYHPGNDGKPSNATWVKYLPSILSLGIVLGALGYITTLSTKPRVIVASNPSELLVIQPNEIYESAASKLFSSSLLNQNKLTLNTIKIAQQLQAQFPELGDVIVTIPLIGRKPIIQTRPSTPALILTGNGGSFVIDKQGRPVLKANQLASSVRDKLAVVTDGSDTTIELGKQLLTTDLVSFVASLQDQFAAKAIQVESYTFPALANELHVKLAGKGYYIKFNTEVDARQQVGTYLAVIDRLDSENISPAEYIDVRVEERAYYR